VAERARLDLARQLTEAYLAVVSLPTLDERLREAMEQASRLFGAASASITLTVSGSTADGDVASGSMLDVELPGGGHLRVSAPGRAWTPAERAGFEQLAIALSGPIGDARLLEMTGALERIVTHLGEATDEATVI